MKPFTTVGELIEWQHSINRPRLYSFCFIINGEIKYRTKDQFGNMIAAAGFKQCE
jgi:hypothetical protein